jgi:hypothetical protein
VGLRLARAGAATIDLAGYRELNDRAADAEAEESGRLAYVAASRARTRLLLSGTIDPEKEIEPKELPLRRRSVLGVLIPELGITGEDGQVVRADAPSALPGVESGPFAPAPISVRVVGAGTESAAKLAYDLRGRGAAPETGGGRPPMLALAERGAAAARSLSYGALADYERCGYRFLAERVLRLGAGADPLPGDPEAAGRPSGMGFGRAVHELLEWSARNSWRQPEEDRVAVSLGREGFGGREAARAGEMVAAWTGSALLAGLVADGAGFRPEVPFRIGLGEETVIRGTIDLLVERPGLPPLFVDYKTDRVSGGDEPELSAAYEIQRLLYASAIAEACGSERVESAYCFLQSAGRPILGTHDAAEIAAGRERIGERVARIRGGDFAPAPSPGPSLCHDCPARARLCPYPPEQTMGSAA